MRALKKSFKRGFSQIKRRWSQMGSSENLRVSACNLRISAFKNKFFRNLALFLLHLTLFVSLGEAGELARGFPARQSASSGGQALAGGKEADSSNPFYVMSNDVEEGKCKFCGYKILGI